MLFKIEPHGRHIEKQKSSHINTFSYLLVSRNKKSCSFLPITFEYFYNFDLYELQNLGKEISHIPFYNLQAQLDVLKSTALQNSHDQSKLIASCKFNY